MVIIKAILVLKSTVQPRFSATDLGWEGWVIFPHFYEVQNQLETATTREYVSIGEVSSIEQK
jgi:hypothetical protein